MNLFCHLRRGWLLILLLAQSALAISAGPVTPVLIVHSYNQDYPWTRRQHEGFVQALQAAPGITISASTESLDTKRRKYDEAYARDYAAFLAKKYAGYRPALIYVTDDNALLFARDHLARLFPDSPVFFSGVNDYGVRNWLDPARFTGVFEKKEVAPNLSLLRSLDARAKSVLLVGDGSNTYNAIKHEARQDLRAYPGFTATFIAAPDIDTLITALRKRDERYLILTTLGGLSDATGRILPLDEAIERIVALRRFTILSMEDVYQFPGVLGGHVTSGAHQGAGVAGMVQAYLNGAPISAIPPTLRSPNVYQIDAEELKRKHLIMPSLPGPITLLNEEPGFLERHRETLLLAVYILSFSLFAVLLLAWRTAKRKNLEIERRAALIGAQADALRASESSYRGLFDSIREAIYIQDETGTFLAVNAGAEKMYGYTREEMRGMDPAAVAAPGMNDLNAVMAMFALTWRGEAQRFTFWGQRKNGEAFLKDVSMTKGDYFGREVVITVAMDITDRHRTEADLRIAAIAFESQESIVITDARQIIQRVNPAFTSTTGYTPEEVIGRTPGLLQSHRHDPAFYQAMWADIRTRGHWQGEIWNRRKNGEIYPEWLTITAVLDTAGQAVNYVGIFQDITERKTAEERIRNLAFYDALTELPNRRLLIDRLHQAMALSSRNGRHGALLFIDLDNFKLLNDTQGHDVGDQLLILMAQRLEDSVRRGDSVARLGGDEFVVMLEELDSNPNEAAAQVETIAQKILSLLSRPYELGQYEYHSTSSLGVTLFRGDAESVEELLKRADLAMYQAKAAGRNAVRFFDPAMQASVEARTALEGELRRAVLRGDFILHYQPQVNAKGMMTGVEALVRWQHAERGLVGPVEFIDLAEETGLILNIGQQVLQMACTQLKIWSENPRTQALNVSINVSAHQFRHPDFVDMVLANADSSGIDASRLVLEITESMLLGNLEETIDKMRRLRAAGIRFSIDDFGTGYSSLAYLQRLPLNEVKIDRSFVADLEFNPNDAAICAACISLAHILGLSVVAEGVETEVQRYFLTTVHRTDMLQGYLFGKPMPAADIVAMLER
jgi:diguanylate cyclase (GGDEF)-like protein/PAS domain S-box-containing protein